MPKISYDDNNIKKRVSRLANKLKASKQYKIDFIANDRISAFTSGKGNISSINVYIYFTNNGIIIQFTFIGKKHRTKVNGKLILQQRTTPQKHLSIMNPNIQDINNYIKSSNYYKSAINNNFN